MNKLSYRNELKKRFSVDRAFSRSTFTPAAVKKKTIDLSRLSREQKKQLRTIALEHKQDIISNLAFRYDHTSEAVPNYVKDIIDTQEGKDALFKLENRRFRFQFINEKINNKIAILDKKTHSIIQNDSYMWICAFVSAQKHKRFLNDVQSCKDSLKLEKELDETEDLRLRFKADRKAIKDRENYRNLLKIVDHSVSPNMILNMTQNRGL